MKITRANATKAQLDILMAEKRAEFEKGIERIEKGNQFKETIKSFLDDYEYFSADQYREAVETLKTALQYKEKEERKLANLTAKGMPDRRFESANYMYSEQITNNKNHSIPWGHDSQHKDSASLRAYLKKRMKEKGIKGNVSVYMGFAGIVG